jgi:hypothetical protein
MNVIQAPFYVLFGALYFVGTLIGLLIGSLCFLITKSAPLVTRFVGEGLGHRLLHHTPK